ncbi:hypothetical protein C8Q75DRAFT_804498 [Abortiporus biennis]|nr:hypothetical protein C8Q75DRAFT_804498 [Abortiporus biennis]
MAKAEETIRIWNQKGTAELLPEEDHRPQPLNWRRTVIWYHNESTFYANDRRKVYWVHDGETAVPQAKGEDRSTSARVFFRAGKNRDGYFTHKDVLKHAQTAMDILEKHYPNEDYILIFDNAPTHLKRSDGSLSAWKMMRNVMKSFSVPFGVEVNVIGSNGYPMYTSDGKLIVKVAPC